MVSNGNMQFASMFLVQIEKWGRAKEYKDKKRKCLNENKSAVEFIVEYFISYKAIIERNIDDILLIQYLLS